jgi:hypothetical protein
MAQRIKAGDVVRHRQLTGYEGRIVRIDKDHDLYVIQWRHLGHESVYTSYSFRRHVKKLSWKRQQWEQFNVGWPTGY